MHDPASYDGEAAIHPIGRVGEISDVVDGILYLERATFVRASPHIDGGQAARRPGIEIGSPAARRGAPRPFARCRLAAPRPLSPQSGRSAVERKRRAQAKAAVASLPASRLPPSGASRSRMPASPSPEPLPAMGEEVATPSV